jgi:energy-coupling factor transporter ATP-binding protein EcfA2
MEKQLESLTIHRFRGLRDLELSGLGDVNLFVGENNSGKTTVLEAISTYCRPLDPLEWLATGSRREIDLPRALLLDALKWLFPQVNEPERGLYTGETFVSGSGSFRVLESRATYNEFLSVDSSVGDEGMSFQPDDVRRLGADLEMRTVFRVEQRSLFERGPTAESSEIVRLWQDERFTAHKSPSDPLLPVATISPISHWVEQRQIKQLTEVTLGGIKDEVLEALSLIDPGIQDLEILSRRGTYATLHIQHKEVGLAPVSAFGDGVRRTLMTALTLPTVKGGILLVDEIQTAIHKSALNKVFGWLVKACSDNNVQLFATTHSLEAVDAMLKVKKVDLANIVAYRLNEIGQPAQQFAGELLYGIRYERGLDVR